MKEWSEVKKPLTFCLRAFTRRTIRINSMMTPRPTIKSGKLETKLLMSSNFCTLAAELSSISTLWERQMTDSVFCSGVSPLRDLFPSDSRNTLTTELLLCKPADSTVSQNCQLIQVHFMSLIHPTGCHRRRHKVRGCNSQAATRDPHWGYVIPLGIKPCLSAMLPATLSNQQCESLQSTSFQRGRH